MEKYIYYATQLPMLFFDKDSVLTVEDFLREGHKWLSGTDYGVLSDVSIHQTIIEDSDPAVLQEYKLYEFALRSELQQYRIARRKKQEYKPSLFPISLLKEGNPLEVEKRLLSLRWQLLEELAFGHYADIEFLCLYNLKLQILQRLKTFDPVLGKEKFKTYTELTYE